MIRKWLARRREERRARFYAPRPPPPPSHPPFVPIRELLWGLVGFAFAIVTATLILMQC